MSRGGRVSFVPPPQPPEQPVFEGRVRIWLKDAKTGFGNVLKWDQKGVCSSVGMCQGVGGGRGVSLPTRTRMASHPSCDCMQSCAASRLADRATCTSSR